MKQIIHWLFGLEEAKHVEGGDWKLQWLGKPGGDMALLIIVGILVVLGLFWWLYKREGGQLSKRTRYLLFSLRLVAFALAIVMLLEPNLEMSKVEQKPSQLLVLVDTSTSMGLADAWLDESQAEAAAKAAGLDDPSMLSQTQRLELVQGLINSDWLTELYGNDERELHIHTFGERLSEDSLKDDTHQTASSDDEGEGGDPEGESLALAHKFNLAGRTTSLGESVEQAIRAYRGQPIAGIIVLTDGRNTTPNTMDPEEAAKLASEEGIHIYSVGVGTLQGPRNAETVKLEGVDSVFIRDHVSLTATIQSRGMSDEPATVVLERLLEGGEDEGDERWAMAQVPDPDDPSVLIDVPSQQVMLAGSGANQEVVFDFHSNQRETAILRARVLDVDGEIELADNAAIKQVNVVPDKTRVLFVSGYSFPEVQFLRNALLRDRSVEVSTWLMDAGDNWHHPATNLPITRMPNNIDELDKYFDCVVLYDPDPASWPIGFSDLLVEFVSQRGGGLVYIAGERNTGDMFERQGDPTVSFLDLLPVERRAGLFPSATQVSLSMRQPWGMEITEAGMRDSIFEFNRDPVKNRRILAQLPGMMWHFSVTREKPGATVLARHGHPGIFTTVNGQRQQEVLMATHLVGPGRVVYLGFDSTYRWRFVDERLFDGFWARVIDRAGLMKQMGGQHPYRLSTDRDTYQPGEAVTITARFVDGAQRDAGLNVLYAQIQNGSDDPFTLELSPSAEDENVFTATFNESDRQGDYLLRVWPGDASTQSLSKPNTHSFSVEVIDEEIENPTLDDTTLRTIASTTQGQYFTLADVKGLPEALRVGLVDKVQVKTQPIWDAPLLIILFMGAIIAEWIIRKRCRLV